MDDIFVHKEPTYKVSALQFQQYLHCFFQVLVFLVLEVFDHLLNGILGVAIVLILVDSSRDVIREVLIEHFIDGGHTGCYGVEKTHLFKSHSRAEIIHP
jgi:hypothetical protein